MVENNYNKIFKRVVGLEGGYQNLHHDRGNWTTGKVGYGMKRGTKYGISAMSYPNLNIRSITLSDAKHIYFSDFWKPLQLDKFKFSMQFQIFDAAVNHGKKRAILLLQKAVGATPDGIIGPRTMRAVGVLDENDLLMLYVGERLKFYTELKTFTTFGRGWVKRMSHNLNFAASDN